MEKIQEYGLQNFLVESLVPRLDDKILYVLKECIGWRNEAMAQGIFEVNDLLKELELIKDMIVNDMD